MHVMTPRVFFFFLLACLLARYERLLSEETRLAELQKALEFLYFDAPISEIDKSFNLSNHFRRESPAELQKGSEVWSSFRIKMGCASSLFCTQCSKLSQTFFPLSSSSSSSSSSSFGTTMTEIKP